MWALLLSLLRDPDKFKALPRRMKVTLLTTLAGLLLTAGAILLSNTLAERTEVTRLRGQLMQLRLQSATLRKQVEQYVELRQRYQAAQKGGILAVLDPIGLVNTAQDIAARQHLPELHYKFKPEELHSISGGKYQLSSNEVSFENGGVLDIDVLRFWDQILDGLSAHYQVTEASLERTGDVDARLLTALRVNLPASTLSAKLTFDWLSLHSLSQEAAQ